MIGERTLEGWQIRLVTRDPGRFFGAGFLLVWLCGWAVGETVVLWILIKGAFALLTGTPPDPGRAPLATAPAVLVGAFLLLWLSLWTLGGIAAIGELLRLLWGEDRIAVSGGRLTATWSRGPFRKVRSFERDAIRRITVLPPKERLTLEVGTQRVELSRLGTSDERREAAVALRTELSLHDPATASGTRIPDQWEVIVTPEGERALVPKVAMRRTQARVAALVAMGAALVTFLIARGVPEEPGLVIPALLVLVVTCLLAWGAVWLARGRSEWRIGHGRLTLRKRYGANVSDVFEARRLQLDSSKDSDGDVWYALYVLGDEDSSTPQRAPAWQTGQPKNSRTVMRLMNDPTTVRDLATWLARETDLLLEDRTTPEAQAVNLAKLRAMLESSGGFGRWAAGWVDRLEERGKRAG